MTQVSVDNLSIYPQCKYGYFQLYTKLYTLSTAFPEEKTRFLWKTRFLPLCAISCQILVK